MTARQLIEFVYGLDDGIEATVESLSTNPYRVVILKRPAGERIDARQFELDNEKSDAALLQNAVEAYEWAQAGIGFGAAQFSECEARYRSLRDRAATSRPN